MMRVAGLLAVALMLVGCVRSLEPVLKPEQAVKIPGIEGKWVSTKGEKQSLDVTATDDGYKVVFVNEKGEPGTFSVHFGHVGEMLLADVMPAEPPDNSGTQAGLMIPVHMAIRVTQTTSQLTVKVMKPDWFKGNLAAHPEEIATVKSDDEPIITASTEQIQAFLTKHAGDEQAWTEETIFVRDSAPGTNPATQKTTAGQ
jgi:hypothetical protein